MAGGKDYNSIDVESIVSPREEYLPDIYIFGFQETCELGIMNVMIWGHNKNTNNTIKDKF